MNKKALVFVSYAHTNATGWGYGNAAVNFPYALRDMEDIEKLSDAVKIASLSSNDVRLKDVVILNWQRMEAKG